MYPTSTSLLLSQPRSSRPLLSVFICTTCSVVRTFIDTTRFNNSKYAKSTAKKGILVVRIESGLYFYTTAWLKENLFAWENDASVPGTLSYPFSNLLLYDHLPSLLLALVSHFLPLTPHLPCSNMYWCSQSTCDGCIYYRDSWLIWNPRPHGIDWRVSHLISFSLTPTYTIHFILRFFPLPISLPLSPSPSLFLSYKKIQEEEHMCVLQQCTSARIRHLRFGR